jgi:hypothetical protein
MHGPDSVREMAWRVIEGYSTWNPRPVVEMKAKTLEMDEVGGERTADVVVRTSL